MASGDIRDERLDQAVDPSLRYGLVGALRYPADEIQFGRAVHALCQADGRVANGFCSAVLEVAAASGHRHRRARATKLLGALGGEPVRSMSEQDLFSRSRGVLKNKARQQGRIDLSFEAGARWRLGIELKFNDKAKRGQQQRYPRVGRPVVFVVRDPNRFTEPDLEAADARHYLGAISWEALLPGLRALPVAETDRGIWNALLSVCDLNGDFATSPPRLDGTQRDADVIGSIGPDIRRQFTEALTKKYGAAGRRFGESLTVDGPYPTRTWGNISLLTSRREVLLHVDVRHTDSSQPVWRVSWPSWRHPIVHRKEYARLASGGLYVLAHDWWTATGTVAPAEWRADGPSAIRRDLSKALNALVRSGVMARSVASRK